MAREPHNLEYVLQVLAFGCELLACGTGFYPVAVQNGWHWRLIPLGLALYFASAIF
jgi:hypothetical protein